MKVKLYPARPKNDETGLLAFLMEGNRILRVGIGKSVVTSHWDAKKGKIKKNYSEASEVNQELDGLKLKAENLYSYAVNQGIADPLLYAQQQLILHIDKLRNREKPAEVVAAAPPPAVPMLLESYRRFIAAKIAEQLAPASVKVLRTTYNHLANVFSENTTLAEFIARSGKDSPQDNTAAAKWRAYLFVTFTSNTVGKHLAVTKRFLHFCADRELITGTHFVRLFTAANIERPASTFALTAAEIEAIESLSYNDRPEVEAVRLLFLLCCYSGLRISDAVRVRPHHADRYSLNIDIIKTRENHKVTITPPLRRTLTAIFDGMKSGAFITPKFTQQINDYLKVIGKDAGLTDDVEIVKYRGNTPEKTIKKKYELLTTHCGRRTNITESLKRGIPERYVMQSSNHKDERSFRKYVKLAQTDVQAAFLEAWK